jgi:hypothetical protein
MQTKLLAKIEELTLYIIEQNKRIEALEQAHATHKETLDGQSITTIQP